MQRGQIGRFAVALMGDYVPLVEHGSDKENREKLKI